MLEMISLYCRSSVLHPISDGDLAYSQLVAFRWVPAVDWVPFTQPCVRGNDGKIIPRHSKYRPKKNKRQKLLARLQQRIKHHVVSDICWRRLSYWCEIETCDAGLTKLKLYFLLSNVCRMFWFVLWHKIRAFKTVDDQTLHSLYTFN